MTEQTNIIPAHWFGQILSTANWSVFEQDLLIWAHEQVNGEYDYGAMGLLLSDADWRALPNNVNANGVVVPAPIVQGVPQEPAPSDGSAADDRRHERELKASLRAKEARKELVNVRRKLKEVLLNKAVVGSYHSVALGAGDMLATINDTPKNIFARLKAHLGTPDAKTFHTWSEVYRTPAHHLDVSEWMRQDEFAHTQLSKYGRELSQTQRLSKFLECYKLSPAVMTCWTDYCKHEPTLALQTFPDALAYVLVQEPNIRASMTKADIGFPPPLAAVAQKQHWSLDLGAAAATEDGRAFAAAAPTSYTQDQLNQAVTAAVAHAMAAVADKYCWLHGYQVSHSGSGCRGIEDGKHIRAKRDSRSPLAATMTFGRQGGITRQQAKDAAEPLAIPRYPGNALKPGVKAHGE
jgi:hypothetical protein